MTESPRDLAIRQFGNERGTEADLRGHHSVMRGDPDSDHPMRRREFVEHLTSAGCTACPDLEVADGRGRWDNPPSRNELDQMAENYRGQVGWDGVTPLDDAGRRLYAARDSGYLGPLDQDGYGVTEGPEWEMLRDLRERNERSRHAADVDAP